MKQNLQTKFDNFESRYDFSATEWTGLERRLDKRDYWRRAVWLLLGSLLLLGLVGSNVALWQQNKVLNQRLSTLIVPITTTEKATITTVLGQTDTLIKRTIIYQYDTIYRKITVVETPFLTTDNPKRKASEVAFYTTEKRSDSAQTSPHFQTTLTTVPTANLGDNHPITVRYESDNLANTPPQYLDEKTPKNANKDSINQEKQTFSKANEALSHKETIAQKLDVAVVDTVASTPIVAAKKPFTKDSIVLKISPFDSLDGTKKDKTDIEKEAEKADAETIKKHPKYTFKMLPLYVGATIGVHIWSRALAVGQTANQYGLKAEIVGTERVRFFADINYSKNIESKSTSLSQLPNEVKPPITEPSLTFKYWEVYGLQAINYIGGVQYRFGNSDKFRPYVAVGFNGTTILPFDIKFEYQDAKTNMDKGITQRIPNSLTHLNRLYGAVGVHWNAFKNGQLAAETYCTTPLTNDKVLTPLQVGLKIGAFYFMR